MSDKITINRRENITSSKFITVETQSDTFPINIYHSPKDDICLFDYNNKNVLNRPAHSLPQP